MNELFFPHHGTALQCSKDKKIGVYSLYARYVSAVSSLVSRDQPDRKLLIIQ